MRNLIYTINTLNNAVLLKKFKVVLTNFNILTLNILVMFQKLNIIDSFLINDTSTLCTIYLSATNNFNFFQKIVCISKPNKYIYYQLTDLVKLRSIDLYNDYILSINNSNHTIINIDEAIRLHTGGLLLLKIIY